MIRRAITMLFCVAAMSALASGCSKALAAELDDLLRAGKAAQAEKLLSEKMPSLVRSQKLGQIDEVSDVLRTRLPNLALAERESIELSAGNSFKRGIGEDLKEIPFSDICEVAAASGAPRLSEYRSLTEYLNDYERQERLKSMCNALDIFG
jgi:hypothetical protein